MEIGEIGAPKEARQEGSGIQFRDKEIKLKNGETVTLPSLKVEKMTLYHGSSASGIQEFKVAEECTVGSGVYLTSDPEKARGYAIVRGDRDPNEPTVYETEIQDLNILNLTTKSSLDSFALLLRQELREWRDMKLPTMKLPNEFFRMTLWNQASERLDVINRKSYHSPRDLTFNYDQLVSKMLLREGYDGLYTFEGGESGNGHTIGDHDSYVVFQPEQVKITKEEVVK